MPHILTLLYWITDHILKTTVEWGYIQFGFRRGRFTVDPVQETFKHTKQELRIEGAYVENSLRLSSHIFDMVGHEKDRDSR